MEGFWRDTTWELVMLVTLARFCLGVVSRGGCEVYRLHPTLPSTVDGRMKAKPPSKPQ